MNIEDEISLRQFARFLLRHTVVQVEPDRADQWQRLFARAMAALGFDSRRYGTAILNENERIHRTTLGLPS
jgi:hypothetical protein